MIVNTYEAKEEIKNVLLANVEAFQAVFGEGCLTAKVVEREKDKEKWLLYCEERERKQKQYYIVNAEKIRDSKHKWYLKNKEKISAYKSGYYAGKFDKNKRPDVISENFINKERQIISEMKKHSKMFDMTFSAPRVYDLGTHTVTVKTLPEYLELQLNLLLYGRISLSLYKAGGFLPTTDIYI